MKVLQQLRELQFYLSRSKLDLFSDKTDCLGHVIDDNGIHAKLDTMWRIREWRIPQNYNEVQKFLRLVQYLALYMPDIAAYTCQGPHISYCCLCSLRLSDSHPITLTGESVQESHVLNCPIIFTHESF